MHSPNRQILTNAGALLDGPQECQTLPNLSALPCSDHRPTRLSDKLRGIRKQNMQESMF